MENFSLILEKIKKQLSSISQSETWLTHMMLQDNPIVQKSSYSIPKRDFFARVNTDTITDKQYNKLKAGQQNLIHDDDISFMDLKTQYNTMDKNSIYMEWMNIIFTLVCNALTFFIMFISLIRNIKESIWELGILRSLGQNRAQMVEIYFAETITIILVGVVLGTIVRFIF